MASGDTLAIFYPHGAEYVATNSATQDTRNEHPVLDFDATTNESIVWSFVMPQHYGGGGVECYIHYSMSTATSGDVDFDTQFERIGDQQQDVDTDSFAAAQSVDNTTVPGTSGNVDIVNTSHTDGAQMDSLATGEKGRLKLTRDATSDTATGDAEVHAVELREA